MKRMILFVLFLYGTTLTAQTRKDQLRQIDLHFYEEDFQGVLELSENLERQFPEENGHLYHKTIAYHLLNRGGDISDLLEFENTEAKVDKFYNYWMGRVHMSRYELDLAIDHFRAFLDMGVYKSDIIRNETVYLLDWAESAIKYYNDPNDYELEHLPEGINSSYEDLSPAFFDGHQEIVFVSDRKSGSGRSGKFQVYHASKANGQWSEALPLTDIGDFDYANAKIEIIEHDRGLYFYKNDYDGSLYISSYSEGDGWTEAVEFDEKLRDRPVGSHFFINDQKDMILFAQGSGDRHDIYQMDLKGGEWTQPYPILGLVNNEGSDEENPFVSHDGSTLYFSSNRDGTIGGYDIFKSEWIEDKGEWGRPVNMGFPINTLDDEVNFELTPSDQSGYLASNRLHSNGGYDIYYFHKEAKIEVKGQIVDNKTDLPVPYAQVKFHPQTYEDESFVAYTDQDGYYTAMVFNRDKFHVEVFSNDTKVYDGRYTSYVPTDAAYLTYDLSIALPEKTVERSNYSTIYQGGKQDNTSIEMIGNKFRSGQKAIVNNIYFEFRSFHLVANTAPVLEQLVATMNKYPMLSIEVAGHTDNIGSEATNQILSQNRAEAVKEYLLKNGIASERITAIGYGDTKPLASNDDELEGRELNRRIEIIAIEENKMQPGVVVSSKQQ